MTLVGVGGGGYPDQMTQPHPLSPAGSKWKFFQHQILTELKN